MGKLYRECGYKGHVCGLNPVQFISRYMFTTDYCVDGHRVSLNDAGEFGYEASEEEKEAIKLYLLDEYADYLRWRHEFREKIGGEIPLAGFYHAAAWEVSV